jgi:branched-chain amino acid transport system substrate-binding protein
MNIRRITTFAYVLAIAALIVGLSGCPDSTTVDGLGQIVDFLTEDPPEMEEMEGLSGEIPVGVVLPLTGQYGEAYGVPMRQGFELALQEINEIQIGDATIMLMIKDSMDTPEGAVAAFDELIHGYGATVILGPAFSSQAEVVFPLANQHEVVAFSPTSSASGLNEENDFTFRAGLTTDVFIPSGVMATQEKLGYTKVATIYDEADAYSMNAHGVLMKSLMENGVEILITETFKKGDTDFSAQLTNIMKSNPDAVFVAGLSNEMVGVLVQGRRIGISTDVPFIIPELTIDDVQRAGAAAEGAISLIGWDSSVDTPMNQAFVAKYRMMYNMEPPAWAAQSYATLHILAEALRMAQSMDAMAIRDALAQTMNLPTALGDFSFGPGGDAIYDPVILKVKVPVGDLSLIPFGE